MSQPTHEDDEDTVARQMASVSQQLQSGPRGLSRFLEPKPLRELRTAAQASAIEHAASLVELNTGLARDTAIQGVNLDRKRRLTEIAHTETAATVELQRQAIEAGCRAMERALTAEHTHQAQVASSGCSEDDKQILVRYARELAGQRVQEILSEQLAPFETADATKPDASN